MVLPGILFPVPVPDGIGIMFTIVMLVTTCLPWCYKNMGVAAISRPALFAGDELLPEHPFYSGYFCSGEII
jgi:hypothetical protein